MGTLGKKLRGFAKMKAEDPERFQTVSAQGGKVAQEKGVGARWTRAQAQAQAVAGGKARWRQIPNGRGGRKATRKGNGHGKGKGGADGK